MAAHGVGAEVGVEEGVGARGGDSHYAESDRAYGALLGDSCDGPGYGGDCGVS